MNSLVNYSDLLGTSVRCGAIVSARLKAKHKELEASRAWKALYAQRGAVERVFSRLKGARALNNITVRGRWKVGVLPVGFRDAGHSAIADGPFC